MAPWHPMAAIQFLFRQSGSTNNIILYGKKRVGKWMHILTQSSDHKHSIPDPRHPMQKLKGHTIEAEWEKKTSSNSRKVACQVQWPFPCWRREIRLTPPPVEG